MWQSSFINPKPMRRLRSMDVKGNTLRITHSSSLSFSVYMQAADIETLLGAQWTTRRAPYEFLNPCSTRENRAQKGKRRLLCSIVWQDLASSQRTLKVFSTLEISAITESQSLSFSHSLSHYHIRLYLSRA